MQPPSAIHGRTGFAAERAQREFGHERADKGRPAQIDRSRGQIVKNGAGGGGTVGAKAGAGAAFEGGESDAGSVRPDQSHIQIVHVGVGDEEGNGDFAQAPVDAADGDAGIHSVKVLSGMKTELLLLNW